MLSFIPLEYEFDPDGRRLRRPGMSRPLIGKGDHDNDHG